MAVTEVVVNYTARNYFNDYDETRSERMTRQASQSIPRLQRPIWPARLERMMEWIPVTDRMPKASDEMTHDDDVLVYLPPRDIPPFVEGMEPIHFRGGIYLGHPMVTPMPADEKGELNFLGLPAEGSDWTIWGYSYFMGAPKPTHWMPLPEKPEIEVEQ